MTLRFVFRGSIKTTDGPVNCRPYTDGGHTARLPLAWSATRWTVVVG